jgi:hypothetical protein
MKHKIASENAIDKLLKQPERFFRSIEEKTHSYFNYEKELDSIQIFETCFKTSPSKIYFKGDKKREVEQLMTEKYSEVITDAYFTKYFSYEDGFNYTELVFVLWDSVMIEINHDNVLLLFITKDLDKISTLEKELVSIFQTPVKPTFQKLIMFREIDGIYDVKEIQLTAKKHIINLKLNYNDDFQPIHHCIIKKLKEENCGVVYLYGKSGTGKTYYIKYLATYLKRNIVFVPHHQLNSLVDFRFFKFLEGVPNTIFILEDIEKTVLTNKTSLVNVIMDITDKILGDNLNIQLICTSQTDIINSPQLERKGRMVAKYEFKELSADKTKFLCNKLGFGFDKEFLPMTLADIYFQADPKRIIEVNKETEAEEKAPF